MATTTPTLTLLTEPEFRASRYADLAENLTGRLSDILAQAETMIETAIDRRLARATYTEQVNSPRIMFTTRQYPIISIASVSLVNADGTRSALATSEYSAAPELPLVWLSTPHVGDLLEITYDAGYDQIPYDVKAAVIIQAVLMMNVDFEAYGVGDGKPPGILYMQKQIDAMIAKYRRVGVGM